MKLQLLVLVLFSLKIAGVMGVNATTEATIANTTDESTTEMNNATSVNTTMTPDNETSTVMNTTLQGLTVPSNTSEDAQTLNTTTVTGGGTVATTVTPISSGNNDTITTTPSVTGNEGNYTMSLTTKAVQATGNDTVGDTTVTTQQNTQETSTSTANMASSNITEQESMTIASTAAMTGSMASSNITEQESMTIASTTASVASSNTTEQESTTIASTTATSSCSIASQQECKENDYLSCVNDGSGQHHCEGCLGGWTEARGKCRKLPRIIGQVTIKFIIGVEATFIVELNNRTSAEFIDLATSCCESFKRASMAEVCNVTTFTNGSIVVNFELGFPENTNINETALAQRILDDANSTGIGLDADVALTVVTVFCENDTCKNGGNCYTNESSTKCDCIDGYTGNNCSISPTTPPSSKVALPGLSSGAIIGIAVACFLLLLIIIIIIAVYCKYKGKNKIEAELGRQQTRDDEVPLKKR